jgi:hypothetical protein
MRLWFGLLSIFAGSLAGLFACMWTRSWDATTRATGWPFPVAIFKLEGDHWVDYFGQGWQMDVNFLVGFLICELLFLAFYLYWRRRHPASKLGGKKLPF